MKKFFYQTMIQWKMDMRSKGILLTYYGVPLAFYLMVGGIFTAAMPEMRQTLTQSMTVWGITMGGLLGSPHPLAEVFGSPVKKAYRVGGIPLWTVAAGNFLSAMVHLSLMSLVIWLTAPLIYDAARPENMGAFAAGTLALAGATLAVGMVFGVTVKDAAKLNMAAQLVFIPSLMLSGILFPAEMLPKALETAGRILPATWGYRAMCAQTTGKALLLLAAITAAGIAVTGWQLKRLERE